MPHVTCRKPNAPYLCALLQRCNFYKLQIAVPQEEAYSLLYSTELSVHALSSTTEYCTMSTACLPSLLRYDDTSLTPSCCCFRMSSTLQSGDTNMMKATMHPRPGAKCCEMAMHRHMSSVQGVGSAGTREGSCKAANTNQPLHDPSEARATVNQLMESENFKNLRMTTGDG